MEETTATKLAALETDVSGLKTDIAGLEGRINENGAKMDAGFVRLFDRLEVSSRRPFPWNLVLSFSAIAATVILALSAWANAYFGQAISAAQREAALAQSAHAAMAQELAHMREESVQTRIQTARLEERQNHDKAEIDRLREWEQSRPRHAVQSHP